MEEIFRTVLEMSITGSWVILAVLLTRMLLRRLPKGFSCGLWAVAGFRLCCPVSFGSVVSLFSVPAVYSGSVAVRSQIAQPQRVVMGVGQQITDQPLIPITEDRVSGPDWMTIFAFVWLAGVAAMVLYALFCDVRLRLQLRTAIRLEGNIWQSEQVDSPFILGIFRPRIYLPQGLEGEAAQLVLAHEKTHLKHFDHVVKLVAYGVLAVHWFNPLCHLAFWLLGRDLEMRCDEGVLKHADRHDYSTALVASARERKQALTAPLAFGESSVKARVKNILRWKPVKIWAAVLAMALCAAVALACAADPVEDGRLADGKYMIANGETGEDAGVATAEIRDGILYIRNGKFDLSGKEWQEPPFSESEWQTMLLRLKGAAPEALEDFRYMELFVVTDETMEEWKEKYYWNPLGFPLPVSDMDGATETFFLLKQGNDLFCCDYYQPSVTASSVWPTDAFLASDRLVKPGSKLDPTVETFAQLDGLMAELLDKPGATVEEKAEADQELYRRILRHGHIRWYLCHVLATEGLKGEKGELAGILFEDVLKRRFEEPLLERSNMTAAAYFEAYMEYALEYYSHKPGYSALNNASGPMLAYLEFYYDYGK